MQQDFTAIRLQYYNHKTTMQAEWIFYKIIKMYLLSISITILLWYFVFFYLLIQYIRNMDFHCYFFSRLYFVILSKMVQSYEKISLQRMKTFSNERIIRKVLKKFSLL